MCCAHCIGAPFTGSQWCTRAAPRSPPLYFCESHLQLSANLKPETVLSLPDGTNHLDPPAHGCTGRMGRAALGAQGHPFVAAWTPAQLHHASWYVHRGVQRDRCAVMLLGSLCHSMTSHQRSHSQGVLHYTAQFGACRLWGYGTEVPRAAQRRRPKEPRTCNHENGYFVQRGMVRG